jgi:hypothetical protein
MAHGNGRWPHALSGTPIWASSPSASDVQLVYDNLEKGSRNHLRAFVAQLERNDATYTPGHISRSQHEALVDDPIERGRVG